MRLSDLHDWIDELVTKHMYAGRPGQGAGDASYATAVKMEWDKLNEVDFSGGAADLFKCFDQLVRRLVYQILKHGGWPDKVITAYSSYMENVSIHNSIAGGVGKGLPQALFHPPGLPALHDDYSPPYATMVTQNAVHGSKGQNTRRRHARHG